jgi:hypothetical protein
MRRPVILRHMILIFLASLTAMACNSGTAEKGKIVATVNGAPIVAADLRKEVAGYGKNNPVTHHTLDDQLKVMIEQKLLIQEAVKLGLDKDEKFAETIKTFWEQTLIRNLIEAKTREFAGRVFVTDAEIAEEYERMRYRLRIRAVRGAPTQQAADEIVLAMRSGNRIPGEETLGPLLYEDVKGSPLATAFDMQAGEVKTCAADGEFICIALLSKESLPVPPLEEVRKGIRDSLLAQKRQSALTEWIATVKKSSKVQIDEQELKGIANE